MSQEPETQKQNTLPSFSASAEKAPVPQARRLRPVPSAMARGIRLEKHRPRSLRKPIQSVLPQKGSELLVPLYGAEVSSARNIRPGDTVEKGQPLTDPAPQFACSFAPVSGIVTAIRPVKLPLGDTVLCAVLEPFPHGENPEAPKKKRLRGKFSSRSIGRTLSAALPLRLAARSLSSPEALGELSSEYLLRLAQVTGIRDEFEGTPLHLKLEALKQAHTDILVGCGMDDDPYADSAGALLREYSYEAAEGLRLLQKACDAEKAFLAASSVYTWYIARKNQDRMPVYSIGSKTPARGVLERKLRRIGKVGFIGVQACIDFYKAVTQDSPQTETCVTVTGDGIWKPRNIKAPIGTPISDLLNSCGLLPGTTFVYVGTVIGGEAVTELSLPVTAQTRCITALKHKPINRAFDCIGCGRCARVCMRGILPWLIHDVMNRDSVDPHMLWNVESCIQCRACSAACPAGLDLAEEVARGAAIRKSGDFE